MKSGLKPILMLLLLAAPAYAADGPAGPSWLNILMLVIVMGLLMAGAWAAKKYGPVAGVKKTMGIEVLGQVPLNQKAGIALVKTGNQVMVLGLTSERISLLKEMPLSDFVTEQSDQTQDSAS